MKTANRQSQHRPQREERKTKEVQELKGENHRLARENARLKKELSKALRTKSEFEGEVEPERLGAEPAAETPAVKCPECGDDSRIVSLCLAGFDYYVCPVCKWRKRADKA